jgi:hypothetical protein
MSNNNYGALFSPKDLRDFRACSVIESIDLPSTFRLDYTKEIKNQGSVNSCVAHALSSMMEKLNKVYSTGWIYGYRPDGYYQGQGMYPREALKTMQKLGTVKNEDFPVNVEMPLAKLKVNEKLDILEVEAEDYKITAYARLYSDSEIKTWLYTKEIGVPIAIATQNLEIDKNNIVQIPKTFPNSGHMMLIIGWNEQGYIVQNSWGKSWGDNGCCILPYEYPITEAWGVTLNNYDAKTDVKKPTFNIIRRLLMFFYKLIDKLLEGGNK